MKLKTKRIIKLTAGIIIMVGGSVCIGYRVGKRLGYDKGVFDVLSARLDNERI